jgi:FkbM family methyltransferase
LQWGTQGAWFLRSALTLRWIAFPWLAQLYVICAACDALPSLMNPVIPAIENLSATFNGLGVWRGKQTVWGKLLQAKTFDRGLYLWMHRVGLMGRAERKVLKRFIRKGMTVVDVGANLGLYSLAMAEMTGPTGRVISFEPDPDLYALFRENCAANGAENIEPIQSALGRIPDKMILHRLTINSGGNHLGPDDRMAFRRPVEVDVAVFDDLYPEVRPDFIKVDVQGWELNVLRGMERTLKAANPVIFLEFWPEGLMRAGSQPEEIYSLVRDLGFSLYSCDKWEELDRPGFVAMSARVSGAKFVNLLASRSSPGPVGGGN